MIPCFSLPSPRYEADTGGGGGTPATPTAQPPAGEATAAQTTFNPIDAISAKIDGLVATLTAAMKPPVAVATSADSGKNPGATPRTPSSGFLPNSDPEMSALKAKVEELTASQKRVAAAARAGVLDPDTFQILAKSAEQSARENGQSFDLDAWTAQARQRHSYLFQSAQPANSTAAPGTGGGDAARITALKTELAEAQKKGDVASVIHLQTQIALAGRNPKS